MKAAASEEKSEGPRPSPFEVPGANPTKTLPTGGNASPDGFGAGVRVILPEKLLTVREVAERLRVCRATVYAMVERGELPCVRVSNAVRFHPEDLAAAVARMRHRLAPIGRHRA